LCPPLFRPMFPPPDVIAFPFPRKSLFPSFLPVTDAFFFPEAKSSFGFVRLVQVSSALLRPRAFLPRFLFDVNFLFFALFFYLLAMDVLRSLFFFQLPRNNRFFSFFFLFSKSFPFIARWSWILYQTPCAEICLDASSPPPFPPDQNGCPHFLIPVRGVQGFPSFVFLESDLFFPLDPFL